MLKVKIKTNNNINLTIPVPYLLFTTLLNIIFSQLVWNRVAKEIAKQNTKGVFDLTRLDQYVIKKELKKVITELKSYRDLILIDLQTKDGTEVKVKL